MESGIETFGDAMMAGELFAVIRGDGENALLVWAHLGDDGRAGFKGRCILEFIQKCVLWPAPR
jgi:hypothetical protein